MNNSTLTAIFSLHLAGLGSILRRLNFIITFFYLLDNLDWLGKVEFLVRSGEKRSDEREEAKSGSANESKKQSEIQRQATTTCTFSCSPTGANWSRRKNSAPPLVIVSDSENTSTPTLTRGKILHSETPEIPACETIQHDSISSESSSNCSTTTLVQQQWPVLQPLISTTTTRKSQT